MSYTLRGGMRPAYLLRDHQQSVSTRARMAPYCQSANDPSGLMPGNRLSALHVRPQGETALNGTPNLFVSTTLELVTVWRGVR